MACCPPPARASPVPLIAWAAAAYAAGLIAGLSADTVDAAAMLGGGVAFASLLLLGLRRTAWAAVLLIASVGVGVGGHAARLDRECMARERLPFRCRTRYEPPAALAPWRARAGAAIDRHFGDDAGLVRALLIADTKDLDPQVRDRYADAGIVHMLSISGLHVAIVSGAMLLLLQAARLPAAAARWAGLSLVLLYVLMIGAPPPAVRSAVMIGAQTVSFALQRNTSPWAALAWGGGIPLLYQPRTAVDLGWQLSVSGFAALIAGRAVAERLLPATLDGWRRKIAGELVVSVVASFATAPLVAWHFGRVSLVAPFSNIAAGPVIALLQPTLFLGLALTWWPDAASLVAAASVPMVRAFDLVAHLGASLPCATLHASPSLLTAVALGVACVAVLAACVRHYWAPPAVLALAAVATAAFAPIPSSGALEVHMIDVGQGDAVAVRTPRGRWLLFDAGRGDAKRDAGRTTVVPYLRARGGPLALFVLSHPHADHAGGAASVLKAMRPVAYLDAAFAGGSSPYRASLAVAQQLQVTWRRARAGEVVDVDGIRLRVLAPDSAWTAGLTDPNLASVVVRLEYGAATMLFTGDAEAPEEDWLLDRSPALLRADLLKVAHHGSGTSTTEAWLEAVQPRAALVSVAARNFYGHPDPAVMRRLSGYGATILRTDQLGSVVARTDGTHWTLQAAGIRWRLR
ncbi:MAG: DNA internalization-related competence protein ComEC/Rec2 [Gemmatimonadetes bacterium]|nr:DNA internalization-related competence protein ComEC/Rec2 [Gemmatimonadota bacterium]